jgi:hypothetical protein
MVKTHIIGIALGAPFSQRVCLSKGVIFPQSKAFEDAQAFDAALFLIVFLEPKFLIRM